MDPVTLLIMCCVLSAIFVGKTAEGVLHAAKGTTPPSIVRERERLAAEQKRLDTAREIARETGASVEVPRRYSWGDVVTTASDLAAMKAAQMLLRRQDKLTEERRATAAGDVQAAEDRLAKRQGLGGRGSANDDGTPAASAPDPIEAGEGGAAGATGEPAVSAPGDGQPEAAEASDRDADPDKSSGPAPADGQCNWSQIADGARRLAGYCRQRPSIAPNNTLQLCPHHLVDVPGEAMTVTSGRVIPGRCHWNHKVFAYADLRCTHGVETGAEINGKAWRFCPAHRYASLDQVQRHDASPTDGPAAPSGPAPAGASEPEPAAAAGAQPEPDGKAPEEPQVPAPSCNWETWAGQGTTSICTKTPSPSGAPNPWSLCDADATDAPHCSTYVVGGELPDGRCEWIFKKLDYGFLYCSADAIGPSDSGRKCCAAHGGGEQEAAGDNTDGSSAGADDSAGSASPPHVSAEEKAKEKKEETGDQSNEPACTGGMSCKACVLVDGQKVCRSDGAPPDVDVRDEDVDDELRRLSGMDSDDTNVIQFPKATTGDSTVTTTETAPNAELDGITAAIAYTSDSAQIARDNIAKLDAARADFSQPELATACQDAANAIDGALGLADQAGVTGEARDALDSVAREALQEVANLAEEIDALETRQREALDRAAGAFETSNTEFGTNKDVIGGAYDARPNAGSASFNTDGAVQA